MAVETEGGRLPKRKEEKEEPSHSAMWNRSSTVLFLPTPSFKEGTWKRRNPTKPVGEPLKRVG